MTKIFEKKEPFLRFNHPEADIDLVRYFDIEAPNRGFRGDAIAAWHDDNLIGYVTTHFIPHQNFIKYIPSIFNYIDYFEGKHVFDFAEDNIPDYRNLNAEEFDRFIERILRFAPGLQDKFIEIDFPNMGLDEKKNALLEIETSPDLTKCMKNMVMKYEYFKNYHIDKPRVQFVTTLNGSETQFSPGKPIKGLVRPMYYGLCYTYGEIGLPFYSASINMQHDRAAHIWQDLERKGLAMKVNFLDVTKYQMNYDRVRELLEHDTRFEFLEEPGLNLSP